MSHWYRKDTMKFEKVSETQYICGDFEIVNVKGYHFAFHKNYLLNRQNFSKHAAYSACVKLSRDAGIFGKVPTTIIIDDIHDDGNVVTVDSEIVTIAQLAPVFADILETLRK